MQQDSKRNEVCGCGSFKMLVGFGGSEKEGIQRRQSKRVNLLSSIGVREECEMVELCFLRNSPSLGPFPRLKTIFKHYAKWKPVKRVIK